MSYDLDAMRKKVNALKSGRRSDPDEFRPAKAESGKELKYRFYILPPYQENDVLRGAPASHTLDTFFLPYGLHFGVCKPPQPCPRISSGGKCPICDHGFELMKEAGDDRAAKSAIGKEWMPADYKAVNIYFPVGQNNPSDLEGRVMFYKAPRTCFDIWVEALERTGPGDSLDPQAYSAFFDENAAFMFQLSCKVKGQNNTYESSGFLANGGTPTAMSDAAGIQQILSARFDLSTKIDTPDIESLNKIAQNLINGVEDDGFGTPSAPVTAAPPVQAAPVMNVAPVPVQPAVQVAPAPVQAAPVQATPVQAAPVQAAPVQAAPVQAAPVQAAPVQAAPVQAAPVQAVPAPVQVAPVPVQAAPVEVAQPAPSEAAPAQAAPAAAPAPAVETVQPPAGGGGGDDVMNEIESMLEGFSN